MGKGDPQHLCSVWLIRRLRVKAGPLLQAGPDGRVWLQVYPTQREHPGAMRDPSRAVKPKGELVSHLSASLGGWCSTTSAILSPGQHLPLHSQCKAVMLCASLRCRCWPRPLLPGTPSCCLPAAFLLPSCPECCTAHACSRHNDHLGLTWPGLQAPATSLPRVGQSGRHLGPTPHGAGSR